MAASLNGRNPMNSDPNPSSGSGGKSMHNPPIRVTGQVMETGMPGRRDVFLKESLDLFMTRCWWKRFDTSETGQTLKICLLRQIAANSVAADMFGQFHPLL